MKNSPKIIGLFQAAALALYVNMFAVAVQNLGGWFDARNVHPDPALSIVIFLFAFIISALVSASCVFAYPLFLFSGGKKKEAVKVIGWNLFWIILFFIAILIYKSVTLL